MIKVFIALNKIVLISGAFLLILNFKLQARDLDSIPEGYFYFINSSPFNAEVYYKDSLLGLTPVRFFSEIKIEGNIILKKKGYEDFVFDMKQYNFEKGTEIILNSLFPKEEKIVIKNKNINLIEKRNLKGILASAIVSLTTGALAYNSKEKANDFYNLYLENRNQDNLDKSRKYDVYSGISLAIMQVSIAALIYFLFLD